MEYYYLGRVDVTEQSVRDAIEEFRKLHDCEPALLVAPLAVAADVLRVVSGAKIAVQVRASAGVPVNTVGIE